MNHTCALLNHSAPHVWGNPASLSTAQKPNREMDIRVRYEKRTNSLGGVSPCTDRNLFKIVSGRSCSPFPYKSSVESCQLPFLYVILCSFWCPRLWHHQNPAALQVSNTSSFSKRRSQLSCLPLVSRPGGWKFLLLFLLVVVVVFLYYYQLQQSKMNYLSQVWITIKWLMLGLSRKLIAQPGEQPDCER